MMRIFVLRNMTAQLMSVRALIDISDPDVRDGLMCDRQDAVGSLGSGRIPSWVNFIEAPSGRRMLIGCMMGEMSNMGHHIMA